jgi:hypothetical protein
MDAVVPDEIRTTSEALAAAVLLADKVLDNALIVAVHELEDVHGAGEGEKS